MLVLWTYFCTQSWTTQFSGSSKEPQSWWFFRNHFWLSIWNWWPWRRRRYTFKIIEYILILAYGIVRHISFQTLSINKLKDGGNVFSPDGRTPRKSRSPLLPKRQSSIIPTSPTTPIKFGSWIFTTPATIEGVRNPPRTPRTQWSVHDSNHRATSIQFQSSGHVYLI